MTVSFKWSVGRNSSRTSAYLKYRAGLATLRLAKLWASGLVSAVEGMRLVVPVAAVLAAWSARTSRDDTGHPLVLSRQ